jgi:hypothetical protein
MQSFNIGVAAHITAASVGGPRYDASLKPKQRAAIENGIWLCQNCGTMIDRDPICYLPPFFGNGNSGQKTKLEFGRKLKRLSGRLPLTNSGLTSRRGKWECCLL